MLLFETGQGGDLRVYLEGLAAADDVQEYVEKHPFGQKAITEKDGSWLYYKRIIDKINSRKVWLIREINWWGRNQLYPMSVSSFNFAQFWIFYYD